MSAQLQNASVMKRTAAGIFDFILTCILAVGAAWLLSLILGMDTHQATLDNGYAQYESRYGITFDISQEEYQALSQQQRESYDAAYEALVADEAVMHSYNMVFRLSILITTFGILLAVLVTEFVVPLLLKNGQTVGKKVFAIALVRVDGVRLTPLQLFVRTVLGKFTIEIMIPVYLALMIFFNAIGVSAVLILGGLLLGELICMVATKNNSLLHDLLAGTAAVDMSTQMIFRSTDDLIQYQKRIAAEQAARSAY